MNFKDLTRNTVDTIARLYHQGWTFDRIAKELNLPKNLLPLALEKTRKNWPQIVHFYNLFKSGVPTTEIGRQFEISQQTVSQQMKALPEYRQRLDPKTPPPTEVGERILRDFTNGATLQQLMASTGLGFAKIRNFLQRHLGDQYRVHSQKHKFEHNYHRTSSLKIEAAKEMVLQRWEAGTPLYQIAEEMEVCSESLVSHVKLWLGPEKYQVIRKKNQSILMRELRKRPRKPRTQEPPLQVPQIPAPPSSNDRKLEVSELLEGLV